MSDISRESGEEETKPTDPKKYIFESDWICNTSQIYWSLY